MLNLDPEERDRFAQLAADWWDTDGPCRPLHDLNPCRLAYVAARTALPGAVIADVGCGGGILSEALASAGARVTGIDAAAGLIACARAHAAAAGLEIDYRVGTPGDLATSDDGTFDLVVCMELIEHVPDPQALIADCGRLLKPGGLLVVSTLNRTPEAYAFGIIGAEYVFSLLPRGTHDYARFVKPSELARAASRFGLEIEDVSGMSYNPLTRRAGLRRSPAVNYFASFRRTAA